MTDTRDFAQATLTNEFTPGEFSVLGAQPLPVAEQLPTDDLGEIIKTRIEHHKAKGKI